MLKNIKRYIVVTLVGSISFFGLYSMSNANEMYMQGVPALCGPVDVMQEFIDDKGMRPENISLGRAGSKPEGEPVYMVTYYVNKEDKTTMAVLDVPSGSERCILYYSFDLVTDVE